MTPGLMDGGLDAYGDGPGAALVREHAERFGADILLTFGPEGASGHADHKAAYRWTVAAAGERSVYLAAWPAGVEPLRPGMLTANLVVDLSSLGDLKHRAFLEHKTQQDHLARHDQIMKSLAGNEYYRVRGTPPDPRNVLGGKGL
jgi:LmbE family N-acetylglucosaminyl deacetylase